MRNLSRREISLIYIAILLLVFYVGNFVFGIPVKKEYEETRQRVAKIQMEKQNLEEALAGAEALERGYREKRERVKESMERFGTVFTGTGLEQHILACLDVAGLEPVETQITTSGPDLEQGYLSGSIEIEAQGSQAAAVRVLDFLEENPALYVESYVLFPEEGTELELWNVTARITYWLPASWEDVSGPVSEDRDV